MKAVGATLAAAMLVLGGQAIAAEQPATAQDARCLALGFMVASNTEGAQAGAMMVTYFQGRIEGREPAANISDLVRSGSAAFDKLSTPEKQAVSDGCFEKMEASRKAFDGLARLK
jgi:hypothetical protein